MQTNSFDYHTFLNNLSNFHQFEAENSHVISHAPDVISKVVETFTADFIDNLYHIQLESDTPIPMSKPMFCLAVQNAIKNWGGKDELETIQKAHQCTKRRRSPVIFHNLAGNLFVSGWETIFQSVLAGGYTFVRMSNSDMIMPKILGDLINNEYKKTGVPIDVVHSCYWPSNEIFKFKQIAPNIDIAVLFGSDRSVNNLEQIFRVESEVISHGNAIAFNVIDLVNENFDRLVKSLIIDFIIYDQSGCLSPRALFVMSKDDEKINRLALALKRELLINESLLPRFPLTQSETNIIANYVNEIELRSLMDDEYKLFTSRTDPFIVSRRKLEINWIPAPALRTIEIIPFADFDQLERFVGENISISSIGTNLMYPLDKELNRFKNLSRICPIGTMQTPGLNWCHDKKYPLELLLQWV